MPQFDDIHRSLDRLGIRIFIWALLSILPIAVGVANIAFSTGKTITIVALALVIALFFFWVRYDLQVRPVIRAERILAPLTAFLRLAPTTPRQSKTRSIREARDRTNRFVEGVWEDRLVAVGFDPPTGSDDNSSPKGHTSVFLTVSHPLSAGMVHLARWNAIEVLASRFFAFLGSPVLKRASDDFGAYGEDAEIARLFTPAVLALVRAFPRDICPTVDGNEIRMKWEGLETDPKVIEAAFHLLKTISDAGAAER